MTGAVAQLRQLQGTMGRWAILSGLLLRLSLSVQAQGFGTLWQVAGDYTAWQSQHSGLQVCSDGASGAYVLFRGVRGSDRYGNLYLQRWRRSGQSAWPASGLHPHPVAYDQRQGRLLAAPEEGLYLAWIERRENGDNVFVQQLGPEGRPRWPQPLHIYGSSDALSHLEVCTDHSGGIQLYWTQPSPDRSRELIYGQRVSPQGERRWGPQALYIQSIRGITGSLSLYPEALGGAILFWEHFVPGETWRLQGQKLSGSGRLAWTSEGVEIRDPAGYSLRNAALVADGYGGAFAVYERLGAGTAGKDLSCLRILPEGRLSYTQPLATAAGDEQNPQLAKQGSGILVVWEHRQRTAATGSAHTDLYAQQLDLRTGLKMWAPEGLAVCRADGDQLRARICSSPVYETPIILWEDHRNRSTSTARQEIYAQKFDADGQRLWPVDGLAVAYGKLLCHDFEALSDDRGGCFLAYLEDQGPYSLPVMQHLMAEGQNAYGPLGQYLIPLHSTARPRLQNPVLQAGLQHDVYLAWEDYRNGESNPDIYLQRFGADGRPLWPSGGLALCTAPGYQSVPVLLPAPGGTYVGWIDRRNGSDEDLYLQWVDSSGQRRWPSEGLPLCLAPRSQTGLRLHMLPNGQLLALWTDARAFDTQGFDLYGQVLTPQGSSRYLQDGIALAAGPGDQTSPLWADLPTGGVLGWMDDRKGRYRLQLQAFDSLLRPRWRQAELRPDQPEGNQREPALLQDTAGLLLLTWSQEVGSSREQRRLYSQKIDPQGLLLGTGAADLSLPPAYLQYAPGLYRLPVQGWLLSYLARLGPADPWHSFRLQCFGPEGSLRWGYPPQGQSAWVLPYSRPQVHISRTHAWLGWAAQGNSIGRIQLRALAWADGSSPSVYTPSPAQLPEQDLRMALLAPGTLALAWLEQHPQGGQRLLLRTFTHPQLR